LTLTAAEFVRIAVGQALQPHEVQEFPDPEPNLRLRRALAARPHPQTEGDILEDRHVPKEGIVLEDEPHAAVPGMPGGHVLSVEEHPARIGTLQACDDPQERRLARSRRPQEGHEFPGGDAQTHVLEGGKWSKAFCDVADLDLHLPHLSRNLARRRPRASSPCFTARVTRASRVRMLATAKAASVRRYRDPV